VVVDTIRLRRIHGTSNAPMSQYTATTAATRSSHLLARDRPVCPPAGTGGVTVERSLPGQMGFKTSATRNATGGENRNAGIRIMAGPLEGSPGRRSSLMVKLRSPQRLTSIEVIGPKHQACSEPASNPADLRPRAASLPRAAPPRARCGTWRCCPGASAMGPESGQRPAERAQQCPPSSQAVSG